jgi:hypothetical protein
VHILKRYRQTDRQTDKSDARSCSQVTQVTNIYRHIHAQHLKGMYSRQTDKSDARSFAQATQVCLTEPTLTRDHCGGNRHCVCVCIVQMHEVESNECMFMCVCVCNECVCVCVMCIFMYVCV